MLTLEVPSERLRQEFLELAAEFDAQGNPRYLLEAADFASYLGLVQADAEGRGFFAGVPMSNFWLVQQGRILGSSRLRHRLTPALAHEGGNIGYDIRPSARRQGFGTALLRLTLERAAAVGLSRALVTCDADNVGSIRIIERNGGVLQAEVPSLERSARVRQYWISL